jgi:hypothetical protein
MNKYLFSVIVLIISSVSLNTASADLQPVVSPGCTAMVKKSALATITGQSKALAKKDFTTAIAFSTADFRSGVSITDFTQIITQSYQYLLGTKNIRLTNCRVIDKSFYIDVKVTDIKSEVFNLTYLIQKQGKKELIAPNKTGYGIAAAQLSPEEIIS